MGLEEYMKSLANKTKAVIDQEYFELEKQYESKFGYIVPREMLPPSISVDAIKKAMAVCIESGKDNIFDVLGVEINENYLY